MRAIAILVALGLIAAAGALYWWKRQSEPPPMPAASIPSEKPLPQAQAPKHPLPAPAPDDKPLPALKESDPAALQALEALFGSQTAQFIRPENLVRHMVVMVDNLPRKTYPAQMSPVNPPRQPFKTSGKGEKLSMGAENFARYAPYVKLMDSIETGRIAATYKRFYPLFQQAYVELGYPNAFFNDRLVEVIDHLLETPEVKPPIPLTIPHVLPEFADPALEERSSGQKLLIRMGPDHAARIKAKLRALRAEVTPGTDPLSPKK